VKTLIELNAALFLISAGILFFVLRYRVHLHVEYTPRKRSGRNPHRRPSPRLVVPGKGTDETVSPQVLRDLESALKNLGASPKEAKERVSAAIEQGVGDVDLLLLRALQARIR
jgi:hypothetical protein